MFTSRSIWTWVDAGDRERLGRADHGSTRSTLRRGAYEPSRAHVHSMTSVRWMRSVHRPRSSRRGSSRDVPPPLATSTAPATKIRASVSCRAPSPPSHALGAAADALGAAADAVGTAAASDAGAMAGAADAGAADAGVVDGAGRNTAADCAGGPAARAVGTARGIGPRAATYPDVADHRALCRALARRTPDRVDGRHIARPHRRRQRDHGSRADQQRRRRR